MIPDLRARLKAAANKPKAAEAPCECLAVEERTPLSQLGALSRVTPQGVRRLGLDLPSFDPSRALFLDSETTGLRGAGTVAFLVGLGWLEGEDFVVRQLLMRDYPEEAHLLEQVADALDRFDCVVSFNGKSFDLPLLKDRFTMARLRGRWHELPQLDLLHAARRTWKLRLGACTLCALEEKVLGTPRVDDLPSAQVPERYFQYIKCRDLSLLDGVLRHNAQDIRTLCALLFRLLDIYERPEEQTSMLDVFSVGRALERCGDGEAARRCFKVASVSELSQRARLELARSYRRERDYARAAEAYKSMVARGEGGAEVYTQLAILLERRLLDPCAALDITEKALWRFSGGDFLHRAGPQTLHALERRRARLKRIVSKQS